ncbi:nuclear transport factor 2 family protein [Halobacillus mangrovi]|uniref:Polyketide cyclase n=1 Tax=Halobacillus mangrovi TaxID=402384 RepID=A0A1W5ZX25_9BACI|nr:nuclear transport factor 2 family protein [Halobacillus mangrovi]ARI77886.1 polyketide cyclase [Halobacillus mangrovi]
MTQRQPNEPEFTNKERAVTFLKLVASGEVREAYRRYIAPDFIHHNPYFRGDSESLKLAMEENASNSPDKTFEVKRAMEERDLVAVHSHIKQNSEDIGAAVVHFFRFQDNQIVELWDVGQPIPEDSPNENGVF